MSNRQQFSTRAQVVTRRTYNRPKDDGTFETWEETVDRVVHHQQWLWERAKGMPLVSDELEELDELRELMLDRKATVSGRTLWLGGTDVSKNREASQFNPMPKDTRFVTASGVYSFDDFNHGDTVLVPTHTGSLKNARVSYMGSRPVSEITFRRGRSVKTVKASDDHNWLLNTGERVQTKDLVAGQDKLVTTPNLGFYNFDFWSATVDEQLHWLYGFVYGDGSIARSGNNVTSRVRLCGNKAQHLDKFKAFGFDFSFPASCGGDPFVYTGSYLKTLPDEMANLSNIKAFLHGYLSADGYKKVQHGQTIFQGISTVSDEAADFIRKYAPSVGLYILRDEKVSRETNYGLFVGTEFSFYVTTNNLPWTVSSVVSVQPEECWCLTVEDDATFILDNGVVTGNCSFGRIETVHDVVDAFWLLLQGCGVGFEPVVGTLNGFAKEVNLEIIRSNKSVNDGKGFERNRVQTYTRTGGERVWHLTVGDSAEAWAKSIGKILALKEAVDTIVLDFSEVRAAGIRLKGYGWISSGDETISVAFKKIIFLLNDRAGKLLTRIDILDLLNHLGTTLSSRRSAEIALMPVTDAEVDDFISAKKNWFNFFNDIGKEKTAYDFTNSEEEVKLLQSEWDGTATEETKNLLKSLKKEIAYRAGEHGFYNRSHRQQSNNSIVFWNKPTNWELRYIFDKMVEAGGSEPGFINGEAAKKRAPWFKGVNPCAEILLGNKSFCNLVEIDWGKFITDFGGLQRAVYLAARANYRQTCVNLDDGVLQRSWHELNEFLRLCGVGATGIVKFLDYHTGHNNVEAMVQALRKEAQRGAHSMADGLGLPRAKAVTTVKPSGTLSKIMDTTEGVHKPLGKYLFNNVTFSKHDEIIPTLRAAGYRVFDKPFESDSVLVTFPVTYEDVKFDTVDGKEVNMESAVEQLERYKFMMDNYVDHNCSVTISFDVSEVEAIVEWILLNWDMYVGVSFIFRNDPTKTAEDLGYAYLPQEVVTKEKYQEYVSNLLPVDLTSLATTDDLSDEACATGACPIR